MIIDQAQPPWAQLIYRVLHSRSSIGNMYRSHMACMVYYVVSGYSRQLIVYVRPDVYYSLGLAHVDSKSLSSRGQPRVAACAQTSNQLWRHRSARKDAREAFRRIPGRVERSVAGPCMQHDAGAGAEWIEFIEPFC